MSETAPETQTQTQPTEAQVPTTRPSASGSCSKSRSSSNRRPSFSEEPPEEIMPEEIIVPTVTDKKDTTEGKSIEKPLRRSSKEEVHADEFAEALIMKMPQVYKKIMRKSSKRIDKKDKIKKEENRKLLLQQQQELELREAQEQKERAEAQAQLQEGSYTKEVKFAGLPSIGSEQQKMKKYGILAPVVFDEKPYTCKKIYQKAGNLIAIPFRRQASSYHDSIIPQLKEPETTAMSSFSHKSIAITSAGSSVKPLVPYNKNSHRSRLKEDDFKPVYRNASSVFDLKDVNIGYVGSNSKKKSGGSGSVAGSRSNSSNVTSRNNTKSTTASGTVSLTSTGRTISGSTTPQSSAEQLQPLVPTPPPSSTAPTTSDPNDPKNSTYKQPKAPNGNSKPGRRLLKIRMTPTTKRHWVTSQKNSHRGFTGVQPTNTAILAAKTKWFHYLQSL